MVHMIRPFRHRYSTSIVFLLLGIWFGSAVAAQEIVSRVPDQPTADAGTVQKPTELENPRKKMKQKELLATLPEAYRTWLDEVQFLISREERLTFLYLEKDYQRDAFIERFWKIRDTYPDTARNEFRSRWEVNLEEVRAQFGSLDDARSRIYMLNDPPQGRVILSCSSLWKSEVWIYTQARNLKDDIALIFFQQGLGPYQLWSPTDGLRRLLKFPNPTASDGDLLREMVRSCPGRQGDTLVAAIQQALNQGSLGFQNLLANLERRPDPPSKEWVSTFNSYSTDLPDESLRFEADIDIEYPGRNKSRTVVQGVISIDATQLEPAQFADHRSYNFALNGEILREDRLFDSFRYQFNLPEEEITDERIVLVFERYLRPGEYQLIVKMEDLGGGLFHRKIEDLTVPKLDEPQAPDDPETARLLAEANRAITSGEHTVQIIPPTTQELHTGLIRVDTLVTGPRVSRVAFSMDGDDLLIKRSPPYSVELDLGELPRLRTLKAVSLDSAGEELARDEVELNGGSHRFSVKLLEPRRNKKYTESLRAEAKIEVPAGKVIDRVEFYLNETLVAALYQEPWEQPILLPDGDQLAYVRAVAYQPDGLSTEELVFVNAPEYLEELDIQFVELYAAVLDRQNRPVLGLTEEAFQVVEDGAQQSLTRFDRVTNLPIHAGVLLDISSSMEESLDSARRAALTFYQNIITPRDRATLITFNDYPNLAVKFTNEIDELAGGLAGLKAERGTALFDSLVFSLYYFNGVKGQRAMIILSDGKDEHSRFTYDNAIEYARRAGVALYTIGLDIPRKQLEARRRLTNFAEETGGQAFFIDDVTELEAIYKRIEEELRSRYYLAYQSTNTGASEDFRTIDVKMTPGSLDAKTLRGYYP